MKPLKIILATTLTLWAAQLLFFGILFVGWFIRFVLQWFVAFGSPQPETRIESLLQMVMNVLTYPARLFLPDHQFGGDMFTLTLQLGIGSAIWGACFGGFIYAIGELRRRANAA